jgi:hypothetical protein
MGEIQAKPEFREIPTLSQTKARNLRRLRKEIMECPPNEDAEQFAERLGEVLGEKGALTQLASFILNQQQHKGPEYVGIVQADLDQMIASQGRPRRRSGSKSAPEKSGKRNTKRRSNSDSSNKFSEKKPAKRSAPSKVGARRAGATKNRRGRN